MKDWRYWLAEQRGTLLALGIFVADVRRSTSSNHPAGFTANVVQTAANKGVLLAFVAMAQTLVVITAGIDLSVGMIFVADQLPGLLDRGRHAVQTALGVVAVLAVGLALRRDQRRHRHLSAGCSRSSRRSPPAPSIYGIGAAAAAVPGRCGQ